MENWKERFQKEANNLPGKGFCFNDWESDEPNWDGVESFIEQERILAQIEVLDKVLKNIESLGYTDEASDYHKAICVQKLYLELELKTLTTK